MSWGWFGWFFSITCSFLPFSLLQKKTPKNLKTKQDNCDSPLWAEVLLQQENPSLTKLQSTPLLAKIMWIIIIHTEWLTFSGSISEWPKALHTFYPRQFSWEVELWERNEVTLKDTCLLWETNCDFCLFFAVLSYKILF